MPFIEHSYDSLNCALNAPNSLVSADFAEAPYVKSEFIKHLCIDTDDNSCAVSSLPSLSSSGQSSPQQTVPSLLYPEMSTALGEYTQQQLCNRNENIQIKSEDYLDTYETDPAPSSENSPTNVSYNDFELPQMLAQSASQHHQLGYYQQVCCPEDDTASENSYGAQTSPILPISEDLFAISPDQFSQYCEMFSRTHASNPMEQGAAPAAQALPDQMRFIIYEPANEGAALVPTINNTGPTLWPTSLASVNAPLNVANGQPTLTYPFDYMQVQNNIPASTSLIPPSAPQLQAAQHVRHHSSAQGAATQQQPIKCPQADCPKTFSRLYNLKAHLRSHSPARPFQCPMCPRSFSRKHDLQRHIRVHTGVKPYQCPCCRKAFARTDALRRHFKMEADCRDSPQVINMKGRRKYSSTELQ